MRGGVILLLGLSACRGKADQVASTPAAKTPVPAAMPAKPADELPPMPAYAEAARGHLAAQSAGPAGTEEIRGEWTARAGICDKPPMLQVVAEEPGVGTIILLAVPVANQVRSYPITTVSSGLPDPPAAQIGVQLIRRTGSFAYQALDGSVDVYAFEKTVSGRFASTLREISSNVRLRYVGAFREAPVVKLDASRCAPAAPGVAPAP